MNILWLSPFGSGWSLAYKLRQAGHHVVYHCPDPGNLNGRGYLPAVTGPRWESYVPKADLLVCDEAPPSRQTRRSWLPSDLVMTLNQARRRGVPYLGPLPTTELLERDPRYAAKVVKKLFGASFPQGSDRPEVPHVLLEAREELREERWWSLDPDGHWFELTRTFDPARGWVRDVVVPDGNGAEGVHSLIDPLTSLIQRLGFHGYINFRYEHSVESKIAEVKAIRTSFLFPAIFAQCQSLLAGPRQAATAVTWYAGTEAPPSLDTPGFFGGELHAGPDALPLAHGPICGASVVSHAKPK